MELHLNIALKWPRLSSYIKSHGGWIISLLPEYAIYIRTHFFFSFDIYHRVTQSAKNKKACLGLL